MSKQRTPPLDVMNLFARRSEKDFAEILAEYFNSISLEFDALTAGDVPVTHSQRWSPAGVDLRCTLF